MRNPNGYGSIINLGKGRRKPFAIRMTVGYDDQGRQIRKYLGYYKTRRETMEQLNLMTAMAITPETLTLKKYSNFGLKNTTRPSKKKHQYV